MSERDCGLRPRPEVPADVVAAVQSAVDRLAGPTGGERPAWRFSGRWFSAHPIRTRSWPG